MNAPNAYQFITTVPMSDNPDNSSSLANNMAHHNIVHNNVAHHVNIASYDANHWLLPDGVHDVLFADADKQQYLRHRLIKQLQSHGYQLVSPPLIEFTESLLQEASEDLKRQTFKLIDQVTGRLMGVRADTTPQIRRIDAKFGQAYFAKAVARYCYAGHVIHTLPNGLFGSRTPLQLGAELFGCDTIEADFELLDVLYALLSDLNLPVSWHLDLGHVGVFKRLSELANLDNATSEHLMRCYANKALPELEQFCHCLAFGQDFYQLAIHGHDLHKLQAQFSADVANDVVIQQSLAELQRVYQHLSQAKTACGDNVCDNLPNISVDLTELSGYHYHTGLVFNLYVNNESQVVARGGRFNGQMATLAKPTIDTIKPLKPVEPPSQRLSTHCQQDRQQDRQQQSRPAIGFSMDVTRLLPYFTDETESLASHWIWVVYQDIQQLNAKQADQLADVIAKLRRQGHRVIKPLTAVDKPDNITHHLHHQQGQWVLTKI